MSEPCTTGCASLRSWLHPAAPAGAKTQSRDFGLLPNFKHTVHFRKIPLHNAVNGYVPISIHSPAEVIAYEQDI